MAKVELFDITQAKDDQRKAELALSPIERLYLCLDLMDLSASLYKNQPPVADDGIEWIELKFKHE
jgi:hypothetical protein